MLWEQLNPMGGMDATSKTRWVVREFFPPATLVFDRRGIIFSATPQNKIPSQGEIKLCHNKQKIQIIVDEITDVKIKSMSGKKQLNTNDYSKIIQSLIERSYEGSNGKKII